MKGKHFTCFPGFEEESFGGVYEHHLAVKDENIITGKGMGATIEFARLILTQFLDEDAMLKLDYGIQYEHLFDVR